MGKLKPVVIFAVIGFVLSFLVGLISGVRFSVLFLRAIILAAVCGFFGFLVFTIIEKHIPELLQKTYDAERFSDDDKGKNLNIVLDDEETGISDEAEGLGYDATDISADTTDFSDSEKNFEENYVNDEFKTSQIRDDEDKVVESVDFSNLSNSTGEEPLDTLEDVPNLDQFEDSLSISTDEVTSDLVDAGTESLMRDAVEPNFASDNIDTMASAVQTVLKKDST